MPHVRAGLRLEYAPLLLIGVNGLAFEAISSRRLWWILGSLLLGAIVLSFVAERVLPYNPDWKPLTR